MTGWDLFQDMDMLRREFDQLFRGFGRPSAGGAFLPGLGTGDYPRINLSEDEDNYYLTALLPGIDPEQIELNLLQGTLSLSGERHSVDVDGATWHRRERGAGRFMRTIELPEAVNSEQIEAEYRHGVLYVTLQKPQQMKPKKISVRAE